MMSVTKPKKPLQETIGTVGVIILALAIIAILLFMVILPYMFSTSKGRHCSVHEPCIQGKRETTKRLPKIGVI